MKREPKRVFASLKRKRNLNAVNEVDAVDPRFRSQQKDKFNYFTKACPKVSILRQEALIVKFYFLNVSCKLLIFLSVLNFLNFKSLYWFFCMMSGSTSVKFVMDWIADEFKVVHLPLDQLICVQWFRWAIQERLRLSSRKYWVPEIINVLTT